MRRSAILNAVGLPLVFALAACLHEPTSTQEPVDELTPLITAWLQENAIPFTTSRAGNPYHDLTPLKQIVGDARIVALGEATHGTREFFEMKHRLLEFLVQEMGFTIFAIESEWAEANRINEYVQTGQGSAHARLTGLYFWTWRTQEVLDLIEWMRSYNANPANVRKVSFVGVDAQFPTLAMDTTLSFIQRADPAWMAAAAERYDCLRPYSNNARGAVSINYSTVSAAQQAECSARIGEVYAYLVENRTRLEAATSPADYAFGLQAARLVVQGEHTRSGRAPAARDHYMAENAAWWLERDGPDARMVIWAHNAHVSTRAGWMGASLRARFGQDLRVMGFSFYEGSFTAVNLDGGPLGTYSFGPAPAGSYESSFHNAGLPRFILDLRVSAGTPATNWLAGPLQIREIGCCHRPSVASWGIQAASLPARYDVIIHFESTSASRLLPAVWE